MKMLPLLSLELRRLLQSRLTWLLAGLTALSPALGLVHYQPASAETMLSMYLANPVIAGGAAGGVLFGLLSVFELDRTARSRVEALTDGEGSAWLRVSNPVHPKLGAVSGGHGLKNLARRYRLLCGKEIVVEKQENCFDVKVPLLYE